VSCNIIKTLLVATLLTLSACSYNQTIANQRNYEIVSKASEGSSNWIKIPVTAEVSSKDTTDQDTSSEAKATPDTISTVTGAVGSLLIP